MSQNRTAKGNGMGGHADFAESGGNLGEFRQWPRSTKRRYPTGIACLALAVGGIVNGEPGTYVADTHSMRTQEDSIQGFQGIASGDIAIRYDRKRRTIRSIRSNRKGMPLYSKARPNQSSIETAGEFFHAYKGSLGVMEPDKELQVVSSKRDELGHTHVKFAQQFNGLPVWPADIRVHIDANGNVLGVNGDFVHTPRLTTLPTIMKIEAQQLGMSAVPSTQKRLVNEAELIIYASATPPILAWKMDVEVSLVSRWVVVVDAATGNVITAFDRVCQASHSATSRGVCDEQVHISVWDYEGHYYMWNASKPMFDPSSNNGWIVVADAANTEYEVYDVASNNLTSWSPADAISAAFNLSETYDYYWERHGRNSLDGNGGNISAVVRYGQDFYNAFWNGEFMVFGDAAPFVCALDVVAHELTHGVTQKESNLTYQDQSGALNEAMSDIFGEVVEARTYGRPDWLKGGTIGSPIQDYADPESVQQVPGVPNPSRMSEYWNTSEDRGGVHINSSIINHCFYLLSEQIDGGIGIENAAALFYRANTVYLTANSGFEEARIAVLQSAADLFGEDSFEGRSSAQAFDSVEIFGESAPPPTNSDDDFEENDHVETATPITAGSFLAQGLDDDLYLFRVNATGRVSVSISGPEGDLDLYILDLNGNVLGASTSESSSESLTGEESGGVERAILVAPYEDKTSPYTLWLEIVPDSAPSPDPGDDTTTQSRLCGAITPGLLLLMTLSLAGGKAGRVRSRVASAR